MNVVKNYVDSICAIYNSIHPNVNPDQVRKLTEDFVGRQLKDIPCQMKNNIKHEVVDTSICSVFEWIDERNPIITGNGTFFQQHEEMLAPTVVMLEALQKERKQVKKKMYQYQKGSIEYVNLNTSQGSIKVIMNADYGGSGTPHSPFYSVYIPPATTGSAKNITTTLICCLEFLSGNTNKWAKIKNINGLMDMIRIILTNTEERDLIHDSYSVDDVLKYLLSRLIEFSEYDAKILKAYLMTLPKDDLTRLMLAFNVKHVLRTYLVDEMKIISDYMHAHQLDFNQTITVESLHTAGFGVKPPEELVSVFEKVNKTLLDNCCYPFILDDVETRANEMQRVIVCVTDTDSLMVHFAAYINEFCTRSNEFRDSCLMATAIGMRLFVESIIPRMVGYVAQGCNIKDKYYRDKFVFKNEFGFLAMALFAKKMYASSMFVQEGNPRDIHDIAISGMSFKKRDAAEFLGPIMESLYEKNILTVTRIQVDSILDKYYELRNLLDENLETQTSYYQVAGLKTVGAYDPTKILPEVMRGALIWNMIVPDEEMQPMDRVIVIRLSPEKLEQHQHDDKRIEQMLQYNKLLYVDHGALAAGYQDRNGPVIDNEKLSKTPVICIPESYKTIPTWIRDCIDKEGTIDKLLTPFKQMLGLFDVYMAETKSGMIASRMVCI